MNYGVYRKFTTFIVWITQFAYLYTGWGSHRVLLSFNTSKIKSGAIIYLMLMAIIVINTIHEAQYA